MFFAIINLVLTLRRIVTSIIQIVQVTLTVYIQMNTEVMTTGITKNVQMAEQLKTERVRTATRGILSRFYTKGNAYHHMRCLRMNINMAIFHRVKGKMMEAISIPKKYTDVMRISRARTETLKELNVLVPSSSM